MVNSLHRLAPPDRPTVALSVESKTGLRQPSSRALVGLLSGLIASVLSPSVHAQSSEPRAPIFVWGFQEGCKLKTAMTAQVMDLLAKEHSYRVEPLLSVGEQALPVCPGSVSASGLGCSNALKQDCSGGQGLVLGGVVDHRGKATRIRLWLYDLQTKKLAVQDDYCQQCDPDDSKVVASHAAALLQAPMYGASPAAQPSYCQSAPGRLPAAAPGAGPLYLGIFGGSAREDARREILRRITLKRAAQQQSAPTATDQRGTDPTSFESVTHGEEGAQVLRIEIGASSAELYLWDQRSRRVATRSVACSDSCRDALESISQATAEILDVCFADRCSLVQSAEHRPSDACVELSKQECPALPTTGAISSGRGSIDQSLARRIEILTGVGLGLSAAVTAGMWVANETVTIERTIDGKQRLLGQTLQLPAGIVTGLTGGLAVLSIPIFYYLEKAKHAPSVSIETTKVPTPGGFIKCPLSSVNSAARMPRRSRL